MVRLFFRQDVGALRRPLNVVFGAPSHVAILRALAPRAAGATGGEIARLAGVAPQAVLDALTRLEALGVVTRLPLGRGYLFRLNRDHELVKAGILPLLEEETRFGVRLREVLKEAFEKDVVTGLIYGSASRGEERPESDLDICLIVRGAKEKEKTLERAAILADEIRKGFGLRLSPLAFTAAEFSRGLKSGKVLMKSIQKDGERFVGHPLEGLGHG